MNRKGMIVKLERKSRYGSRGPKQRYSVFKAKRNLKWLPYEEAEFFRRCEARGLDPDQFLSEDDKPHRKWRFALNRLRDYLRAIKEEDMSYINSATPVLESIRWGLRNRPGLYLGENDIDKLRLFADAIILAEDLSKVDMDKRVFPIDWAKFEPWVLKKTVWPRIEKSFTVAKHKAWQDNVDPIKLWFSWYDEFQEELKKKDYTEIEE